MRLSRPFDSDDYIFELKIDGFRSLPYVGNGQCDLVSRNGNDSNLIFTALMRVDLFDGKPHRNGGRPIDVAAELHQLAATTPDNLMWPTFGPEQSKQRFKDHIERKAVQVEKTRQK
jgi:hypothetical protein